MADSAGGRLSTTVIDPGGIDQGHVVWAVMTDPIEVTAVMPGSHLYRMSQHNVSRQRGRHGPTDKATSEGVDDEADVGEPEPWRDRGDIADP